VGSPGKYCLHIFFSDYHHFLDDVDVCSIWYVNILLALVRAVIGEQASERYEGSFTTASYIISVGAVVVFIYSRFVHTHVSAAAAAATATGGRLSVDYKLAIIIAIIATAVLLAVQVLEH
jgi:hypothetical protein